MSTPVEKARALYEARATRTSIPPFTDAEPELGVADGCAVQQELTALLLADGDRGGGHKVGLTAAPLQKALGIVPLADLDTRLIGTTLTRDGEPADTGAGAAALGDPVAVVAWPANTLGEHGVALEPGHLILTGALHAAVPMSPGDVFRAEFDRLGPVTVRVT
ncbi:hypothetical protein LWC35_16695 [Pseudonocardia kujensis]|uniref:2-keto-4-pentenoate hydratase n=1 Tax=Pseudonocardia kujensis TaxID=1128675 RepID=UPI001E37566D|nr:fumarylacetoacetate hydrolase family protein [Pseudonocardia kujensis]MCE0764536.1 hypothetical protein [Pseudonocardia kujensis]